MNTHLKSGSNDGRGGIPIGYWDVIHRTVLHLRLYIVLYYIVSVMSQASWWEGCTEDVILSGLDLGRWSVGLPAGLDECAYERVEWKIGRKARRTLYTPYLPRSDRWIVSAQLSPLNLTCHSAFTPIWRLFLSPLWPFHSKQTLIKLKDSH